MTYDLIIFDIDGTLAERDTDALLPGVLEWFTKTQRAFIPPAPRIALVTNQGGFGLRRWMEAGGFGDPAPFPTEADARAHVEAVQRQLPLDTRAYICFAYQSKKSGKWAPLPDGIEADDPEWDPQRRKPAPGMLFDAIRDAGTTRVKVLMVGDSQEDAEAAAQAEVRFEWADAFFGRSEGQ